MSTRFQPLFGAKSLAAWVRAGGRPERKMRGYYPRLYWHAHLFEHNLRTQTARVGAGILPEDPVFIVGLWRSGTTVFHELLTMITGWSTPLTWQCFNPSTCFLSGRPTIERAIERPMDHGRISSFSPQEDEFAVLLLGEPSIYRAFIDPRRLHECGEELWSMGDGVGNHHALMRWRDFVRGLSLCTPTGIPLLFKSPSHTFRIPLLQHFFPQARFIWVGRDSGEVLTSNWKMWRAMIASHGLWECPDAVLNDFFNTMMRTCAGVLARCLEDMPRDRMLWVDFQELQAGPTPVLQRVLRFLGVDEQNAASPMALRIADALSRIPIHAGSRTNLGSDDHGRDLAKLMAAARQRFG